MTTELVPVLRVIGPNPAVSAARDLVGLQTEIFQATRPLPRPVGGLMTYLIDRRNLAAAWDKVASSDGADTPGPDGVTCSQLKHQVGSYLAELADDLFHQRYRPAPPRRVEIPKSSDPTATRAIGIPNIRDRIVQNAIRQVLEPVLDPTFLPTSFAFRPGRSVAAALDAATAALSAPPGQAPAFRFAVPLDIADCFPTIDHALLRADLARHIADDDLLRLIDQTVAVGGERTGGLWWQRLRGIVQGGPLSPLLCNLYLHPLDEAADRFAKQTSSGIRLLRYADDLLLLARDARTAATALATLKAALKARCQRFKAEPPPKPAADGVDWLGVRIQPRRLARPGETAFGYIVPPAKLDAMIERILAMTQPPSDKIDAAAFNLGKWIVSINDQLRDWRQVYLYADNAPDLFRVLDAVAFDQVGQLIKSVLGLSAADLRRLHLARLPRGFRTWEVAGTRLSVLSALAPCAPTGLTRKPLWWKEAPTPEPKLATN